MPVLSILLIILGVLGFAASLAWALSLRRRGGIATHSPRMYALGAAIGCSAGAASAGVLALFRWSDSSTVQLVARRNGSIIRTLGPQLRL
jgi:hypothetical protein